ncbi:peptide-methionine (S)-S-oxide reductase MsrA [Pseudovibrio exalbescens]|uniref:peptide-methionine (S)-S-oxide reductase MsrA n=1 Tax=Pseudovibrio exalbescens TaxID=197461 RepID=UPI002365ECD5|nr:peptide-methionine (S)-S-oxide reductase MsrA [Pseudovibrio exalbescens]MDD7911357.1 peptide-methionine (S)-S-oxide reductase MsrA [Pseudovibrio exalbescens]
MNFRRAVTFSLIAASFFAASPASAASQTAIFAGGCFWCVESDFDKLPGVLDTTSGYIGGSVQNPTYQQVTAGGTGHREAVRITYDPERVSYDTLLDVFWHSVDPTDAGGQFCDRGFSYSTAIYATSAEQLRAAQASKQALNASGKAEGQIVTPIERAAMFYPAEDYHQDYYKKSPIKYKFYRFRCGRDQRVNQLWGDEAYKHIN